jgi:DNA-binding NarL/FixJ family response regulator
VGGPDHPYPAPHDQHDRARIALVRSNLQLVLGRLRDARSTLSEAIERTQDPQLRLRLCTQQANQAYNTGHMGDAVELGDRLDDPLSASRVRALACAGRTADAIAHAQRAIGLLEHGASGDSVRATLMRMTLLQGLALHGHIGEALDLGNAGLAEAGSSPLLVAFWAHELGHVSLWAGRARSAARWLRETLALAPVEGLPAGHQLWSLDGLAEAYALLGDAASAAAQIARLESVLPHGFVAPKRSGAVWAVAAAGEVSRACDLARRYGEGLAGAGALLMAGWVWHEAARLGSASKVDADIALLAGRSQSPLLRVLARSAAAHAQADPAEMDAVAGQFAAMGCPIFAAESATEASRIYGQQGRAGSATAAVTRALAYRAGGEPAHTPLLAARPAAEPLTRRESEVAGLAARGRSDHEIALRLQLSVRTVHSHLYRAYRKLGISDRGELPAALRIDPEP